MRYQKRFLVTMLLIGAASLAKAAVNDLWTNVTPSGANLDPNYPWANANFGFTPIAVDPIHPNVIYSGVQYGGLWRSTDYGKTWQHWNQTADINNGGLTLCIAPDGSYMIGRLLYPTNGAQNGAWKSTDGGVNWTRFQPGDIPGSDVGSITIDPFDESRVILTSHWNGTTGGDMFESVDTGKTWTDMGDPGANGGPDGCASYFWLSNDHLLAVLTDGDAKNGPMLGTRSGSTWPWTWSWALVPTSGATVGNKCPHGGFQIVKDTVNKVNGREVFYIPGLYGIDKGTYDVNGNFTLTRMNTNRVTVMVATPSTLYATYSVAFNSTTSGAAPNLMHAARVPGTGWVSDPTPTAFHALNGAYQNGWASAIVTFDGTRYIIVAACFSAGIWRYEEPTTSVSIRRDLDVSKSVSPSDRAFTITGDLGTLSKKMAGESRVVRLFNLKGGLIAGSSGAAIGSGKTIADQSIVVSAK